ncbi:hypothetical protein DL98DRAFT_537981 [Cadophora sp. DSE1049]|nr:hypothetical protein DL98DRAFT_537981 [Cadophora sp. DSE1049]
MKILKPSVVYICCGLVEWLSEVALGASRGRTGRPISTPRARDAIANDSNRTESRDEQFFGGVRDECPSQFAATVTEDTVRAPPIAESLGPCDGREPVLATDVLEWVDVLGGCGLLLGDDVRDESKGTRGITSQERKLY